MQAQGLDVVPQIGDRLADGLLRHHIGHRVARQIIAAVDKKRQSLGLPETAPIVRREGF